MEKSMKFIAFLAATAVTGGVLAQGCPLATPLVANPALIQSGMMFDIIANNAAGVEITSFDVHAPASALTIQVYIHTGGGTFVGSQNNAAAWTLVDTFNIQGAGQGLVTPMPAITSGGGPNGGVFIASGATQGFLITNSSGTALGGQFLYYDPAPTAVGTPLAQSSDLTVLVGEGIAYPFSTIFTPRQWEGVVHFTFPGQVPDFETNSASASADISGVLGAGSCSGAIITRNLALCVPITPVQDTLNVSAQANPGPLWELVQSPSALLPASAGGLVLPVNGEVVNLSLIGLSFLNGGGIVQLTPMPGSNLPGATGGSLSVPFANSAATDFSIQVILTNASVGGGFELTQATEYHVSPVPVPTSFPGPTGDDQVLAFDPTVGPTCWIPSWSLFGVSYTQMFVDSNGRLMASSAASDFTPTLAEALSGPPTLGIWADLSPNVAGTITFNNPSTGVVDIDFAGVPYFGLAASSTTFSLEIDNASQNVSIISDISGAGTPFSVNVDPNGTASNMFVGVTPGSAGAATDPGIVNTGLGFAVGAGIPTLGTDMIYDFLDTAVLGSSALPLSFAPGSVLSRIDFLVAPIGALSSYAWSGQ